MLSIRFIQADNRCCSSLSPRRGKTTEEEGRRKDASGRRCVQLYCTNPLASPPTTETKSKSKDVRFLQSEETREPKNGLFPHKTHMVHAEQPYPLVSIFRNQNRSLPDSRQTKQDNSNDLAASSPSVLGAGAGVGAAVGDSVMLPEGDAVELKPGSSTAALGACVPLPPVPSPAAGAAVETTGWGGGSGATGGSVIVYGSKGAGVSGLATPQMRASASMLGTFAISRSDEVDCPGISSS